MSVKGTPQLRARMRAIKQTFKPVGKAWATDTVHGAQARVAVRTGATRRSIRIKNASHEAGVGRRRGGAPASSRAAPRPTTRSRAAGR